MFDLPNVYNLTILDLKDTIFFKAKCNKYKIFEEVSSETLTDYVENIIKIIEESLNQKVNFRLEKNVVNEEYEHDGYDNYWLTNTINSKNLCLNIMINSSYEELVDLQENLNNKNKKLSLN
ncbi:MAG TPA: hypothetical protein OIM63_00515 [Bacilli bacterium]|nr:hypothetical protein [Bacilli bacterium]